ncbi:MAG: cytochrome b subunit of the bc complex [Bacillota bacterium]
MANSKYKKGTIPFIPNHLLTEAAVALFFIGIILFLSGLIPRELGEPANKLATPEHIKPEWYYLWMFEMLKLIPSKILGLLASGAVFVVLALVPWLDKSPYRRPSQRPVASAVMGLAVVAVIVLTIMAW